MIHIGFISGTIYPFEQYRESASLLRIHRAMSFRLFFLSKLVDG